MRQTHLRLFWNRSSTIVYCLQLFVMLQYGYRPDKCTKLVLLFVIRFLPFIVFHSNKFKLLILIFFFFLVPHSPFFAETFFTFKRSIDFKLLQPFVWHAADTNTKNVSNFTVRIVSMCVWAETEKSKVMFEFRLLIEITKMNVPWIKLDRNRRDRNIQWQI